jgi:hypothetical protein
MKEEIIRLKKNIYLITDFKIAKSIETDLYYSGQVTRVCGSSSYLKVPISFYIKYKKLFHIAGFEEMKGLK